MNNNKESRTVIALILLIYNDWILFLVYASLTFLVEWHGNGIVYVDWVARNCFYMAKWK